MISYNPDYCFPPADNLPEIEKILAHQEKQATKELIEKRMKENSEAIEKKYKIKLVQHLLESRRGTCYKGVMSVNDHPTYYAVKFFSNDFKVLDEYATIKSVGLSHPNVLKYVVYYPGKIFPTFAFVFAKLFSSNESFSRSNLLPSKFNFFFVLLQS